MDQPGIIILAAGKGKRMGGIHPKVMFKLGEKPLLDYAVQTAQSLNPSKIVVIVGFGKEQVIEHLSKYSAVSGSDTRQEVAGSESRRKKLVLHYAVQEPQLGTGHAVQQAAGFFSNFNGNVILLNGDVPFISSSTIDRLLKYHTETKAGVTVLTANYKKPYGYGRIVRDSSGNLLKIVEEKDATEAEKQITEINAGTFVFDTEYLFSYLSELERDNAQEEYYITDIVEILKKHDIRAAAWQTSKPEETYGINTPEQLDELKKMLLHR